MRPHLESAEALAGASGATNPSDDTTPPAPRFPADIEIIFGIGALLLPAGVARFRTLGIPPHALDDDRARTIVAALLADAPLTEGRARHALERARPGELSYAAAMLTLRVRDAGHAVRAIDRLAEFLAARWLPTMLRWCAARLERGEPLRHVADDLAVWLRCARPQTFAEGVAA